MSEALFTNEVAADAPLALSIVMPFYRNDPSALLFALSRQVKGLPVELLILDDGSGDAALLQKVQAQLATCPVPATFIACAHNFGRSHARNRLKQAAKAPYLLLLDSDMLPDSDHFVADWLALIARDAPAVAYGGFSVLQVPDVPELAFARTLAQRSDCQNAQEREKRGVMAVATSNLLVRADILAQVSFDSAFKGWGWEDVEWALRVQKAGHPVQHVDIPATHMGLDRADIILDKFAQAGANFKTFVQLHPDMESFPALRLAMLVRHIPFRGALKALTRAVALHPAVPLPLRCQSARLWRALWAQV
ncbi:MAG: hypothetical protein RLZZ157_312 [Pseudomonadota bacterium]|jgi:glycosyltransferase involved in cell wall biosynthesis